MIFRVLKNNNYTVMSNYHLRDKTLSLKAKGLLSLMLSLPEDWDYSISGLVNICKDGETAIRSALKELEDHKYLKRERVYENGKITDWNYIVYEEPENNDADLDVDFQQQGFLQQGFNAQINTDKQNTKKPNTISSKDDTEFPNFSFGESKPKKKNLYQKCSDLINEWTNIDSIRNLLFQYLDLCMEMQCIRGANQWKGMLNTLERVQQQCHPHTYEEIIQLSIEHGWKTFYPIKEFNNQSNIQKVEGFVSPKDKDDGLNHNISERTF